MKIKKILAASKLDKKIYRKTEGQRKPRMLIHAQSVLEPRKSTFTCGLQHTHKDAISSESGVNLKALPESYRTCLHSMEVLRKRAATQHLPSNELLRSRGDF